MRRYASALILVGVIVAAAGCGAGGPVGAAGAGEGRQLEDALIASIKKELADEGPLVDLRSVSCRERGSDRSYSCVAHLGVQGDVFTAHYAVEVDANDCWRADAERVSVLRAGPNTRPSERMNESSNLSGCLQ